MFLVRKGILNKHNKWKWTREFSCDNEQQWKWKNIFEESKWSPRINHLIQKGWGGVKVNQQGWTSKRREVKVNVEMVFRNGKWKWKVNVEICLRNGSDVSAASTLHSAGIIALLAVNFPGKRYHPLQLAWYAWGAKEMLVKIIKGCIRLNGQLWSVHGSNQVIDLFSVDNKDIDDNVNINDDDDDNVKMLGAAHRICI